MLMVGSPAGILPGSGQALLTRHGRVCCRTATATGQEGSEDEPVCKERIC